MGEYIYRLIAYRDGEEVTLAEYSGSTEGLYYFKVKRVERKVEES